MFTVYILKSEKDNKRYIGCTENLDRRLNEINAGLVKSTKNRRPLRLIYSEQFENKSDTLQREKLLKSGNGREFLNKIMKYI